MTNHQLQIKRFVFGPFQTNTYVVSVSPKDGLSAKRSVSANGLSGEAGLLLIDPACSTDYEQQELYNYLNRQSIVPRQSSNRQFSIVSTHGHLDHLWGAKWATEQWQTPILMHEADIPLAQAMQDQYDLFGIPLKAKPFPIDTINLQRDDFFQLSSFNFQLLSTPGHTPGSICLYFPEEKILFSGDTLFRMGYGRTDLPGGNTSQLISSLQTLFALPGDVRVFPGHGQETTIAAERR